LALATLLDPITDSTGNTPATTTEVEKFLSEPLLDYKTGNPSHGGARTVNGFLYCQSKHNFTCAHQQRFFGLLSLAGNLHDNKRNRILPSPIVHSEQLLFGWQPV